MNKWLSSFIFFFPIYLSSEKYKSSMIQVKSVTYYKIIVSGFFITIYIAIHKQHLLMLKHLDLPKIISEIA